MNKNVIIGAIAVVIILAGGYFAITNKKVNNAAAPSSSASSQSSSAPKAGKEACAILTPEIAAQLVPGIQKGDGQNSNASTDSIKVSSCNYITSGQPYTTMNLLARSALDTDGKKSNADMFGDQKPAGVEDVSGVGDKAYWNPTLGQLSVLKNDNWYIISQLDRANPATAKKDTTLKIYEAVKNNL